MACTPRPAHQLLSWPRGARPPPPLATPLPAWHPRQPPRGGAHAGPAAAATARAEWHQVGKARTRAAREQARPGTRDPVSQGRERGGPSPDCASPWNTRAFGCPRALPRPWEKDARLSLLPLFSGPFLLFFSPLLSFPFLSELVCLHETTRLSPPFPEEIIFSRVTNQVAAALPAPSSRTPTTWDEALGNQAALCALDHP